MSLEVILSPPEVHEAPPALAVTLVSSWEQLRPHAGAWNRLAGDVPFRSWQWTSAWWDAYGADLSLGVLLVHNHEQELVGIAPWCLEHSTLQGRVLRFIGSGEVCSDYLTLLCAEGWSGAVACRIGDWLAHAGSRTWDLIDFSGIERADECMAALVERLDAHGLTVDRQADENCWRTELPESWDAFLALLSKSRRERTRSMLRKSLDTGRAVVHSVGTEEELDTAFRLLIELHQKRRATLDQPGCFVSERFTRFHRDMAAQLLAAGALRMFWIELDGRPVAVEYSFAGGDTIYYYQGGFEPEVADQRPGWLSFAVSLRRAIEDGYRHFDFLRGDEPYKASWHAAPRGLVRVRVAGRSATARVRFAAWQGGRRMKQLAAGWRQKRGES